MINRLRIAGINFNDGFGGGNIVEFNCGFNMVRETLDHGVLNTWYVNMEFIDV